ncbi:MAG: hypothetical protein WCF65_08610 [Parachlamydiaceae bacterium]
MAGPIDPIDPVEATTPRGGGPEDQGGSPQAGTMMGKFSISGKVGDTRTAKQTISDIDGNQFELKVVFEKPSTEAGIKEMLAKFTLDATQKLAGIAKRMGLGDVHQTKGQNSQRMNRIEITPDGKKVTKFYDRLNPEGKKIEGLTGSKFKPNGEKFTEVTEARYEEKLRNAPVDGSTPSANTQKYTERQGHLREIREIFEGIFPHIPDTDGLSSVNLTAQL